jgi:hypothetical protein
MDQNEVSVVLGGEWSVCSDCQYKASTKRHGKQDGYKQRVGVVIHKQQHQYISECGKGHRTV